MNYNGRISSFGPSLTMLQNLQKNYGQLERKQDELSSGKVLRKPSDGPANAVSAVDHRAELERIQQFSRNSENGLGWLSTADTSLTATLERTRRVRELSLQAANIGASDPQALEALAVEIEGIRDNVVALANAQHLGRPVFGGFTKGDAAVVNTGGTPPVYATAPGVNPGDIVVRNVAPNVTVAVSVDLQSSFEAGGVDLFNHLTQLAAAVRAGDLTGPTGIDASLATLGAIEDNVSTSLAAVGARYRQVADIHQRNLDVRLDLERALTDLEDVDVPKALIEVRSREAAYQTALAVTAKVIQPSLLDFLR